VRYLESKWSSLISLGLTLKALRHFLPMVARGRRSSVKGQ